MVGAAALAVVGLVALAVLWRWRVASGLPGASQRKTVLAVLPFNDLSGNPDEEFFGDGLTEEMIAQIGKLNRDRLTVIARSSIARYRGSRLTAKEIGQRAERRLSC